MLPHEGIRTAIGTTGHRIRSDTDRDHPDVCRELIVMDRHDDPVLTYARSCGRAALSARPVMMGVVGRHMIPVCRGGM